MESSRLLQDFLLLFVLAAAVLWVFHRLRLPSISGFLLTGFLVGPFGQGWVREVEAVRVLADIGVVLLLFTIGAEFSLRRLVSLRRQTLGGGALQVAGTMAVVAAAATHWLGSPAREGFVLGAVVALSSTAIVMRQLAGRGQTAGPTGRAALGMLIFQDLCIVPLMIAVSVLGGRGQGAFQTSLIAVTAFAALLVAARLVIPRMLAAAAQTRSHELFVFTVGVIILGAAWISAQAGLSLALGAFVAGIVVADNAYSHQVLTEVLPFRESFLGLFFTSVGMLADPAVFAHFLPDVLFWLVMVVAGKILIVLAVAWLLRYSWPVALRTAFALAQIGEFSFVIAGAARANGLLGADRYQILIAVSVLSMTLSPLLLSLGERLAKRFGHWRPAVRLFGGDSRETVTDQAAPMSGHVVIVGFGLNGKRLATTLRGVHVPALALEIDPTRMHHEQSSVPLLFGDASSAEVLDAAGLERALALVVAVSDLPSTQRILHTARQLAPEVPVIVRTRHLNDVGELYRLGAREVVVEEVEASLEILLHLLAWAGVDEKTIRTVIRPYLKHPLRHPVKVKRSPPSHTQDEFPPRTTPPATGDEDRP